MQQIAAAIGIGALAVLGLLTTNILRDRGVDASVSRRAAAILAGGAYLIAVLYLDFQVAVALAVAMAALVVILRARFRRHLRGVSNESASTRWGEAAFAVAGAGSLAIGWGLLGDRWLGFVPVAFMAWGDNAAGIVRARLSTDRDTSLAPSATMLAVCLVAAAFFQPWWIGGLGALAATAAERFHPTVHPLWDDNWTVVAASLAVMGCLGTYALAAQPR
jgi:dolichol kinase